MYTLTKTVYYLAVLYVSQGYSQLQPPNNSSLQGLAFFIDVNTAKYKNAEGSKYIFDDFRLAKIDGLKGSHLIRFDVVDNTIELKKDENSILGLSKKYQYKIEFLDGSGKFETQQFKNEDGKTKNTFFEKKYTATQFTLYLKHRIKFEAAKPAKSSYEPALPAKFSRLEPAYYILNLVNNPGYLVEIPRKKKALLQFFGSSSKEVGKYIKNNKLKINSEKDLIKVLEYYFSLSK